MNTSRFILIAGASTGIGRSLAWQFARRGSAEIRREGGEAIGLACDVFQRAQVQAMVSTACQQFDRIDWAILSAGISQPTKAEEFQAANLEQLCQTNLFEVAYCLEELIPRMRQQGRGKIDALSSLAGDRGMPVTAHPRLP